MTTYPLARDGVFWTVQGEGALLGEPMAFVRLAGCSVGCQQCDTDYRVSRRLGAEALVKEIQDAVPVGSHPWPWVWLTGGEPTDHDIEPLIGMLQAVGFRVALTTSGVRPAPAHLQWLSVSPHSASPAQTTGHELKVVPGLNGLTWADVESLSQLSFPYRFLQPLWWQTANGPEQDGAASRDSLQACLAYVRSHPGWRLGIQAHKYWNVP